MLFTKMPQAHVPDNAPHILVVEDDAFDQRKVAKALTASLKPFKLSYARYLDEARTKLNAERFDAVLLDNQLPDGHGYELAAELAADPAFKDIPVIMITGYPTPFVVEQIKQAGVQAMFPKNQLDFRVVSRLTKLIAA